MPTLEINLPTSLDRAVAKGAEREGLSMNQLIVAAVEEKLSAPTTEGDLEERAARGSRERFEAVLRKVPDVETEERDRLG